MASTPDTASVDQDYGLCPISRLPLGKRVRYAILRPDTLEALVNPRETITADVIDKLEELLLDEILAHVEDQAAWQAKSAGKKQLKFDVNNVDRAPDSVSDFLKRLIAEAEPSVDNERRDKKRFRVVTPVLAVPVDTSNRPIGHVFQGVTRDVSTGGMSMLHTRSVNCKRLAVELTLPTGERKQIVMEVLRCRPMHRFYEIAGRWCAKLD